MIHELRMYTVRPGTVHKVLEASGTVARRVRGGDGYGKLEGHWYSEIGPLNQYIHLWGFANLGERERLRAELTALPAWREEFVPLVRPHIMNQRVRIMRPIIDMKTPPEAGNLYELRVYRLPPGKSAEWCGRFVEALPTREKYSMNVGLWAGEFPDPNEVYHMWSYPSFDARMEARAAAQADPAFQAFLSYTGGVIETMHSMLMYPSPYSPRQ